MPIIAALLLAACSSASPAPNGWEAVSGSTNAWTHGAGSAREDYSYFQQSFPGSLQDLASQVTIDVLTRNGGAKLRGSDPFAPCPGEAGLATFSLRGVQTLQAGFAVRDGRAVRTTYVRPARLPADPNVTAAMQNVLCQRPL